MQQCASELKCVSDDKGELFKLTRTKGFPMLDQLG